jgi:hypothetical protein
MMRISRTAVFTAAIVVVTAVVAAGVGASMRGSVTGGGHLGGGAVTGIRARGGIEPSSTSTDVWTDVPKGSVRIKLPPGSSSLVARFSGEADCDATTGCAVRLLINGQRMAPIAGKDHLFAGPGTLGSAAMERFYLWNTDGAGEFVVQVQYAAVGGGTFVIDDWTLVVERAEGP